MTNEQLAALAQEPDNAELVPVLWEKVKSLLYQKQEPYTTHERAGFSNAAWNYGTFGKAAIWRFWRH